MKRRHAWFLAAVLAVLAGCNRGSGDRVLVDKCLYDSDLAHPRRYDVVVFKYPVAPMDKGSPKNYIKRLLGLPGQILAIFFGQIFFWEPGPGEPPPYDDLRDPTVNANDLWHKQYMHIDDEISHKLFDTGKFQILRKPPEVMMALRRIVNDNDYQPDDLPEEYKRWAPGRIKPTSWKANTDYRVFSHSGGANKAIDWLRYQNLLRPEEGFDDADRHQPKPSLITDFEGYNQFVLLGGGSRTPDPNWAGDLMLECTLNVDKAEGAFYMELSKSSYRYRARFDLENGQCILQRQGPKDRKEDKWQELATKPTTMTKPGSYNLRFANFDCRLTVWVDGKLPFGDGHDYPPPNARTKEAPKLTLAEMESARGPRKENDLEPASVGSQGAAVQVSHLRLWRDTYYTMSPMGPDVRLPHGGWANPNDWKPIQELGYTTMYVQPGHYLCMGDNSTASSDSRDWGLVPQRLMLGRALLVYYPFSRAGPIR